MRNLLLAATALAPLAAHAATYTVVAPGTTPGAGQFASLNALAQQQEHSPFLQPGDVIQLPAGALAPGDNMDKGLSDVGTPAKPVVITAPAGQYTVVSNGGPTLANGKSPFTIYSSAVKVNGVIFLANYGGSNGNGAGIRMGVAYGSGPNGTSLPYNLTVTNSAFIGNGNGILADDCSNSPGFDATYGPQNASGTNAETGPCTVTIDRSQFVANGDGSGLTHGMYIDRVDQFKITNSLMMAAFAGHNLKSRAFNNDIEGNRIFDGPFGYSNNDIDIPQGGNLVVKGNTIEKGPYGQNDGVMISYNEEEYYGGPAPFNQPNNPGVSVDIEGNTFIDHWSAVHGVGHVFRDASWWTGKDSNPAFANQTNSPDPQNETFTFVGNTIYSPTITTANWCEWCWAKDTLGANNQFLPIAQAPALDTSSPIAWNPPTVSQQLVVQMNGVQDTTSNWTHDPTSTDNSTFPQAVLWWNGTPLTPAPVVVKADALNGGEQSVTYTVPAMVGRPNYLAATFVNPGCCFTLNGQTTGRALNWQSATLGGVPAQSFPAGGIINTSANPPAVFAPPKPQTDTTPPVLGQLAPLTVAAGQSVAITAKNLNATDPDNTAAQLTYKVTTLPRLGTLKANGASVVLGGKFTQADVAAGRVGYTSTGSTAATDSVAFTVVDPAGNTVSGTLGVTVTAPKPPTDTTPPVLGKLAPLTATAGKSVAITSNNLNATDPDNTAAQLTYSIAKLPAANGAVRKSGVSVTSWTQADVNAGSITYAAPSAAVNVGISVTVTDPAGNSASGMLSITVSAPQGPTMPAQYNVAPGIELIPHSDGSWGWK